MKTFKNSDQMKSFMKKESARLNISISNVYSTFLARSILCRISKYDDHSIIVKGSSAEISYLGRLVRAITDIDLTSEKSYIENKFLFDWILKDDKCDNFDLSFLNFEPKRTRTGIYKMPIIGKFDKILQPIGIDFQEKYNRLIEPQLREMPAIFEGDQTFNIYVPSFEEYLAEKLCIIVESNKQDVLNTRVKDFYDIYQLHGGKYDSDKLTEYFRKMINLRGKTSIEKIKTLGLNKDFIDRHMSVWNSTKKKYDFLDKEIDFEGAVYYTRAVLREQLQKSGKDMEDNISKQLIK